MTDLGRAMRNAAETAAAETVAPPFARIERRHRARRTRQVALAGAAAVALGGIAVAAPGIGGGPAPLPPAASPSEGSLRYHYDLTSDRRGAAEVRACLSRAGFALPPGEDRLPYLNAPYRLMFEPGYPQAYDACVVASGYRPFAVGITPELRENDRRDAACKRETTEGTFERGRGTTGPWELRTGFDGNLVCLLIRYDGRELPSRGNEERRLPVQRDDRMMYHRTAPEVLLYGWRDPRVVRIEIELDGRTYEQSLERSGADPAVFYAMTVPLPRGTALVYQVRAFDGDGRRVGQDNVVQAGPAK